MQLSGAVVAATTSHRCLYNRVVRFVVKIRLDGQNDTMLNRIIIIRMFTHVYRYYCYSLF